MQSPNAEADYQQNAFERLVLKPGWRFKGLQIFSTGPWKAWAFVLLIIICVFVLWVLFQGPIESLTQLSD